MTAFTVGKKTHKAAWKMTPGKFFMYFFMYAFAIICLIPLVWLVRTAFVPRELELDMLAVGWWPTFANITRIWSMAPSLRPVKSEFYPQFSLIHNSRVWSDSGLRLS